MSDTRFTNEQLRFLFSQLFESWEKHPERLGIYSTLPVNQELDVPSREEAFAEDLLGGGINLPRLRQAATQDSDEVDDMDPFEDEMRAAAALRLEERAQCDTEDRVGHNVSGGVATGDAVEPTHEPSGGAGGQEPPPTPSSPASDMLPSDVEGLQAANKRLALENDTLRSMNASLREELASLEAQQQARSAAHTATSQEGAARQAELDASQERVRILTGRLKALEHATGQLPHSDSLQLPEVDLQRPVDELFDELSDALVRLDEAGGNIRLGLQAWMDAFHSKLHDEMGGAFPSSEDNRRLALCVNRTSHRFGIRAWSSYRERPASLKWDASNERFALSLPEHHGAGRSTASASKALPRIELRYL